MARSCSPVSQAESSDAERLASQSKPFLTPANAPVYAAVLALIGATIAALVLAWAYNQNFETQRKEATESRVMDVIRLRSSLKEPGSGEIDADCAADHVESRHGFERRIEAAIRRLELTGTDTSSDLGRFVIQALEVPSGRFLIAKGL